MINSLECIQFLFGLITFGLLLYKNKLSGMKNIIRLYVVIITALNPLTAQITGSDNIVGKNYTITSQILNEDRNIEVYLPESYYKAPEKTYPVMYILDGQRFFLHTVSLHQTFVEFSLTPEFIIVGINNIQSRRNATFSSGAKLFSNYIEHEVIQFIDQNFRTSNDRLLYGWAYGGGFVLQNLISKPELFNTYLAASPFPVFSKIKALDSLSKQSSTVKKLLYYSSDINEAVVKRGTDSLNAMFAKPNSKHLKVFYQGLHGEEHRSTPYTTLYHGIKRHFYNYPQLKLTNLEDYKAKGGMDYVYSYYKQRAIDYGLSTDLSSFAKYALARHAINADDYLEFENIISNFNGQNFIDELRLSRACEIADFYKTNQKYLKSIAVYESLIIKHPKAIRPLQGISDVYSLMGQHKKAKHYTKKAEALARVN